MTFLFGPVSTRNIYKFGYHWLFGFLMGKKLVPTATLLFLCFFSELFAPMCLVGAAEVGVKKGDWIEYNVTTTGNPPEEHNVTWARLEILQVQGDEILVNSTTAARNGSISSLIMTLNLKKGQIGAWWIIYANLNPGDTFYDAFINQNITINGQEELLYAGAIRTITNTTVPTRTKRWDKETGVFVLSRDNLSDYTINVDAYSTNLWKPSQSSGMNPLIIYAAVVAVVAAMIAVSLLLLKRRKPTQKLIDSDEK